MMNFQPITIEDVLRELARDDHSPSSMKFRRKLREKIAFWLPPSQCLLVHQVASGQNVRPIANAMAMKMLIYHKGIFYTVPGEGKGANGKHIVYCRLTEKGEQAAKAIQAVAQATVDKINANLRKEVPA